MNITLEQIDLLRQRANVSYQTAKEALEKANGNMVDALVYLEKDGQLKAEKRPSCESTILQKTKELVKKGNRTKFIIKSKEDTLLNIPVNAAILIGVVAPPVAVIGIPVALLTNHRIKIEKENGEDLPVSKIFDKMSCAVQQTADKLNHDSDTEQNQ